MVSTAKLRKNIAKYEEWVDDEIKFHKLSEVKEEFTELYEVMDFSSKYIKEISKTAYAVKMIFETNPFIDNIISSI